MVSSILDNYSSNILEAKLKFPYNRDVVSKLTRTKICFFGMFIKVNDFNEMMVEEEIIDVSNIQCPNCNGKLDLQNNSEKNDGLRWFCNNKVSVDGNNFVLKRCSRVCSA